MPRPIRNALILAAALPGLLAVPGATDAQEPEQFLVESPTMRTGEMMPRDYTPDGRNLSPPLRWSGLPDQTRQIAVILQDHGAGFPPPWVHWIIYNIPATADGLPEGVPVNPDDPMPREIAGAIQGSNGWGIPVYRGPAPPGGNVHHYHFAVFALGEELDLPPGLDREELLEAMEGHVVGRGDIMPIYERQPMNRFQEEDEFRDFRE